MNAVASPPISVVAGPGNSSVRQRRIPEFEGLRGLMAWWVVLMHLLLTCGWTVENMPRGARLLAHGDYAVDVFVILSGFVIFKLIHDSREPYGVFILRRFLRLFPLLAVCMGIALIERPLLRELVTRNAFFDPVTSLHAHENWAGESRYFPMHLLGHLSLLHGMIPAKWLPGSSIAILAPAWSISLEWQFYLIAPLVFLLLERGREAGWICFGGVLLICSFFIGPQLDGQYVLPSFLPLRAAMFGVGIVSFFVLEKIHDHAPNANWGGVFFAGAALAMIYTLLLPLGIWFLTLAAVTGSGGFAGALRAVLNSRLLQRLGRISYSTYLVHFCCIWPLWWLLMRVQPHTSQVKMFSLLAPATVISTWLLSELLHRCVEKPGIEWGRKLRTAILQRS